MRNFTLATLAVLAVLLLAVSGVAAHGSNDTDSDRDRAPENASADEWAAWMEQHMTGHMDAAQMQDRMNYGEMGEHMASHRNGSMDGMMNGGASSMGCH